MKSFIALMVFFLSCFTAIAQEVSFSNELSKAYLSNKEGDFSTLKTGVSTMDSVKKIFNNKVKEYQDSIHSRSRAAFTIHNFKQTRKLINGIRKSYIDSIEKYQTLYFYAANVEKVNNHIIGVKTPKDTIFKTNFRPRKYAFESIRFFENDSVHLKFFKNNTVNFSPATRQMSLYTEILNDYFAAFRIGIGFQIKTNPIADSTNVSDSTEKILQKNDLVGNLQNQGGGDFNINIAYPLIKNRTELALINYRVFAYGNMGVSLPFLNKNSSDFILNSDIGLQSSLYSNGFNENITIYSNIKIARYFGNSKYRKIISDADLNNPTSFWLTKASVGLAFMDGYRISFDLYPHFGNQFIKTNFPATISFTIRPSEKKN